MPPKKFSYAEVEEHEHQGQVEADAKMEVKLLAKEETYNKQIAEVCKKMEAELASKGEIPSSPPKKNDGSTYYHHDTCTYTNLVSFYGDL